LVKGEAIMKASRRAFIGGAAGLALSGPALAETATAAPPRLQPALDAIRAYARAHQQWMNLPALTLSVFTPDGFSTAMHVGLARPDAQAPVTPATLFQIGSISKCMTAAVLHRQAAEGKLRLDADIRGLLPEIAWPAEAPLSVQQVLDHVAGLPSEAPPFLPDGLWLGFAPGTHWSYSNLGYACLGMLAERIDGATFDRVLEKRLFGPLGMRRTHGAIVSTDRMLYAQGYEPAVLDRPFLRGNALAPAAWVDESSGAGCVASTAADMALFLRALAAAATGKGGLGLDSASGRAFANHFVPSATPGMDYGNGLMHVTDEGRPYLHHTGGMVSFSSSFHVDAAAGIGAFASASISYMPEYRPRALTLYAIKALRAAMAGAPIPAPPPLEKPLANAMDYAGRYTSRDRSFEVRPGTTLTLVAAGREAPLAPIEDDVFASGHPAFADWPIRFGRSGSAVTGAGWGPDGFAREGAGAVIPASNPALARHAGKYVNDSPWLGIARIVERGGTLWGGGFVPMTPIGEGVWRFGKDDWSPERVSFANPVDGRPRTMIFSGNRFERRDV
jgi:CubicO group peptidase (beta-lactamase class C family)